MSLLLLFGGAPATTTGTPIGLLLALTKEISTATGNGTPIGLLLALTQEPGGAVVDPGGGSTTPAVGGGGGGLSGGSRHKRSSGRVHNAPTEDEVRETYERIMGIRREVETPPTKETRRVAKAVNKFALIAALQGEMPIAEYVDWERVAADHAAVSAIYAAYHQALQDEEDAAVVLLLLQ